MIVDPKRQWFVELLNEIVPEIEALIRFDTPKAAERLSDALIERADDNEPGSYAKAWLSDMVQKGCAKEIEQAKRLAARAVIIYRDPNGKAHRRRNPGYRSSKQRQKDGTIVYQQAIWWEFTFAETASLHNAIVQGAIGANQKAASFGRVFEAHAKRQDVAAGQACRLAGIDPREIEITDADIRRASGI